MDRNMIEMKELTRDSRNLNDEASGILYSSLTMLDHLSGNIIDFLEAMGRIRAACESIDELVANRSGLCC